MISDFAIKIKQNVFRCLPASLGIGIIPARFREGIEMNSIEHQNVVHIPVMVNEVIELLDVGNGLFVDATAGLGGHSRAILEHLGENGYLLALEKDPESFRILAERLGDRPKVFVVQADYIELCHVVEKLGLSRPSGILFDLGISSFHIEHSGRGFSYRRDEVLDMRFDPTNGVPAWHWINTLKVKELGQILEKFGELRNGLKIARSIVEFRQTHGKIMRTSELNEAVSKVVATRRLSDVLPRVYQAFRIFVNKELEHVAHGLAHALACLEVGGRLVVISYHSLEDRIVKGIKKVRGVETLTKKPLRPSEQEVRSNRRARSAKLRAYRKLEAVDEKDIYDCIADRVPSVDLGR